MRLGPKLLGVAAVATLALTACADAPSEEKDGGGDYAAGGVTLDAKPDKIVSLSATATEMLFAIDAGDQVEAVDSTSNYPKDAPKTDLDAFNPNVESIAGYEPDLVVVSHDQEGIRDKLKEAKIPTYYAPAAASLDDSYEQIEDLGALTGHRKDAKKLTGDIESEIDTMVEQLPSREDKPTVYYELDDDHYTLTSDTFAGSLLKKAGLVNIADGVEGAEETGGYPKLTGEFILSENPDFVFATGGQTVKDVTGRQGWDSLEAVKKKQVYSLDADVSSRWGPRVVDLMRDITDAVAKSK
ncbi:ABC transporter substrate-binding protein [Stackebrandtia nassauensis]|uniref:Periplasmic binding protein n=1 Tax=Stackebrandtia nassauensis (strain DSM 44728 / CIP 108903 / NRRL B-16338 / NBRC 102104 / LLR-40K-21) TaxID=446470 RepID=D3Q462_STANL|nr:ABC transporter substrate-binding protein [Stackebrandtia nassauensis]ADD45947.1 periplasmic binding protein [Stackebrandtia nassauensis DSM 44728]